MQNKHVSQPGKTIRTCSHLPICKKKTCRDVFVFFSIRVSNIIPGGYVVPAGVTAFSNLHVCLSKSESVLLGGIWERSGRNIRSSVVPRNDW